MENEKVMVSVELTEYKKMIEAAMKLDMLKTAIFDTARYYSSDNSLMFRLDDDTIRVLFHEEYQNKLIQLRIAEKLMQNRKAKECEQSDNGRESAKTAESAD